MRLVKGVPSGSLRSATAEAGLVEMFDYSLVAQRVIGLENQQVVGPARQDLLGDGGLAAHGVQRHDAVLQCELVQQFRDGCDLVGRLVNTTLAQHKALLARPGTHEVQGGSLQGKRMKVCDPMAEALSGRLQVRKPCRTR